MAKRTANSTQISLFPETLYEYHILLSPSDAIKDDVDNLKQVLHEQIGIADRDRTSIAHISLMKMEAFESTSVKDIVKKVLAGEPKFTIKINGYAHFEHGKERTLYLKLDEPESIDRIAVAIKNPSKKKAPKPKYRQTSIVDKPERKTKLSMTPHITIARNISEADFEKIDFAAFEYQNEWVCDRVIIRRRLAGTDKLFSPAGEVKLG
ncbi:2'-5' RNA ligase family protein [Flavobacterium sp. RHBU_24]|uniref:2'-5' RNA ligase family protein n=1 Tax=Flavobacterium sp. RHBU_24 TaxID=3391185 RepID=UPI0039850E0C